jgi:predicted branched-subunit amino acid permease
MQLLRGEAAAEYRVGAKAVLPFAAVIATIGVLFGYLATAAGLSPLAAVLMSGTTFAGSAQLAAISVLAGGGTAGAAVSASALLNARYVPLGVAIAPALQGPFWKRLLLAQFVVDEAWAVAYLGEGRFSRKRLVGAGIVLYATHVAATALGTSAATLPGDPSAWGLDAAFPALFVILLWPHVGNVRRIAAAVLGATIALGLTPLTPPGIPVVAAGFASFLGAKGG